LNREESRGPLTKSRQWLTCGGLKKHCKAIAVSLLEGGRDVGRGGGLGLVNG